MKLASFVARSAAIAALSAAAACGGGLRSGGPAGSVGTDTGVGGNGDESGPPGGGDCVSPSDDELCAAAGFTCGPATLMDRCANQSRAIASCGACAGTCTANVCWAPVDGTVTLAWKSPAANATVKGTTDFQLTGTSLVNVEIFYAGSFFARCTVAPSRTSADCSIDTTMLADGAQSFTAHAWNTPPGDGTFTSDADAGPLAFTVANGGGGAGGGQTVGGGSKDSPAQGPAPAYPVGGANFVLVKNWDFGTNGTIKSYADLDANFQYHDQFGTIDNGGNYGAETVASSQATALAGQPIENPAAPVRQFLADSMKTLLVPLDGSGTASPGQHNLGCGSFQAKWTLPAGGSRLGQDILWETRVRYVTPPYFWFAIWTAGNQWDRGAEFDLVESFGYDNGGGNTNFDGRAWHSNSVPGSGDKYGYANWAETMAQVGFPTFDATQWHTWSMLYKADDSYAFYCDGKLVQSGTGYPWTLGASASGAPLDMSFLFDAGWGHNQVSSVNHSLPFSAFDGKYYEWDYSRVYLR